MDKKGKQPTKMPQLIFYIFTESDIFCRVVANMGGGAVRAKERVRTAPMLAEPGHSVHFNECFIFHGFIHPSILWHFINSSHFPLAAIRPSKNLRWNCWSSGNRLDVGTNPWDVPKCAFGAIKMIANKWIWK
jgi:hypothetical protein